MRRAIDLFLVAALLLPLGACGDDFDPEYWIDEPRLIGVVAEPPELDVGQTSTLQAIVATPHGEPVKYAWYLCDVAQLAGFSGNSAEACVNPDRDQPYLSPLGETASVQVTMPNTPLDKLGLPDYTLGLFVTVRVDLEYGDGKIQRSLYRLRRLLPTPIAANQNPRLRGLFLAPEDLDASSPEMTPLPTTEPFASFPANGELRLQVLFEEGSAEGFLVIAGDITKGEVAPATELLRTSWFTDFGTFSQPTTGQEKPVTELSLDKEKRRPAETIPEAGSLVQVWVVSRDERGGTTTASGTVRVLPPNLDMK